ncbi:MAG: hypothetical protein CMQ24_16880 [Gammaproteobacteria bacterium]|nr:hypothetical protein [Gammaproteobacteria bacterium]
MGLGAATTLAYALFDSFAILLAARLAWGLSWSFIRHASVTNLAATDPAARGQMMGFYSALSRTGGIAGIVLGELMFDIFGFEATFLLLALVSALAVPMPLRVGFTTSEHWRTAKEGGPNALLIAGLCVSAVGPGLVMSTLGFVLMDRIGESLTVAGLAIGIATLNGLLLGSRWIFDTACGPLFGALADRYGMRLSASMFFTSGLLALAALIVGDGVLILSAGILWFFASGTGLQVMLAGEASRHGSGYYARFATAGDVGAAASPLIGWSVVQAAMPNGAVFGAGGLLYVAGFAAALAAFRTKTGVPEHPD